VLDRIQLAARCGVRLVLVPPRRMLNSSGQAKGAFSGDSAKRFTDRYAAVLPPDTLRKYRGTILGLNLGDDYSCASCWGGRTITQVQVAAWAAYTRTRLPGLPGPLRADDQLLHGVASARHLPLSTTLKAGCIFFLLFGIAFLPRRRSDL
jgi:hypothetical protein